MIQLVKGRGGVWGCGLAVNERMENTSQSKQDAGKKSLAQFVENFYVTDDSCNF